MNGLAKLRPLVEGDTIGVVAPSSPQRDDRRLLDGMQFLRERGFRVVEGEHLWDRHGYLAGSDAARTSDLNSMLRDPTVRMVVAGRGGYGATRILDEVDYDAARATGTILLGFSDVTALNLALLAKAGLPSFSGVMPGVDLWRGEENDKFAVAEFLAAVTGARPGGKLTLPETTPPLISLVEGEATGRLIPVNLTLFAALCGSPFLPDMNGALLLLEEIGEEVYRVDRLLSQLLNAGILHQIGGLLYGAFTGTDPRRISVDPLELDEILLHYARVANVPTIAGLPYGHVSTKMTLPMGVMTRMVSQRVESCVEILEDPFERD